MFLVCNQGGHPGRARRSRALQGLQIAFGDVETDGTFSSVSAGFGITGHWMGKERAAFSVTVSPKSFSGACLETAWGGRLPGREEGGRGLL